jgi:hypothetical protein
MKRKALCVARVIRQPVKLLYAHGTALRTVDTPSVEFQEDAEISHRQIPYSIAAAVIASPAAVPAL